MSLYTQAIDLLTNPKHTIWLSPTLLALDAVLCALIIWKIPCTSLPSHLPTSNGGAPQANLSPSARTQTPRSIGRHTCSKSANTCPVSATTRSSKGVRARSSTRPHTSTSTRGSIVSRTEGRTCCWRRRCLPCCTWGFWGLLWLVIGWLRWGAFFAREAVEGGRAC